MTADTIEKDTLHQTSLAVWDIPTPAAGERFSIKVGAKSSAGCALGARRIEVLDGEAVVAAGHLGDAPWPGTDALFWAEVELLAPDTPGLVTLAVRFDAAELDEPHEGAASPFKVSVVAKPEHMLTVKVVADGVPGRGRHRPPRPHARDHRRLGVAAVQTGQGPLRACRSGRRDTTSPRRRSRSTPMPHADRCPALPEPDPDAVWTA